MLLHMPCTCIGEKSYYPPGAHELCANRLFGMYHSCTPQNNKDTILKSLMQPEGTVRIIFATVALGMGIDLQDVNTIIHYGVPRSLEDYFQESGRGGRTGARAKSIVFWRPRDCPSKVTPSNIHDHEVIAVRHYLENTLECRRKCLLSYFDLKFVPCAETLLECCDVCSNNK